MTSFRAQSRSESDQSLLRHGHLLHGGRSGVACQRLTLGPHVTLVTLAPCVCDFNHCVHLASSLIMSDQVFPEPWQKSAKRELPTTIGRR